MRNRDLGRFPGFPFPWGIRRTPGLFAGRETLTAEGSRIVGQSAARVGIRRFFTHGKESTQHVDAIGDVLHTIAIGIARVLADGVGGIGAEQLIQEKNGIRNVEKGIGVAIASRELRFIIVAIEAELPVVVIGLKRSTPAHAAIEGSPVLLPERRHRQVDTGLGEVLGPPHYPVDLPTAQGNARGQGRPLPPVTGLFERPSGEGHAAKVDDFSVGPWRWVELLWPNVSGQQFPIHRRWVNGIPAEGRVWTPSLYMGLVPFMLVICRARFLRGTVRSRWLSWLAVISIIAALGSHGLAWLVEEIRFHFQGATFQPSKISPGCGGLYWLMTVTLPSYSDRITIENRGSTFEGRPLLLLTITSTANHGNIENIRQDHMALTETNSGSLDTSNMPALSLRSQLPYPQPSV